MHTARVVTHFTEAQYLALVGLPVALAVDDAFRDIAPPDRDLD